MNTVARNRRQEERVFKELPLDLGSTTAVTRNVSPSGIYFEADTPFAVGTEVQFTMELKTPEGDALLRCRGEIVRIKPQDGRVGMAVKIVESSINAA